jgi:diguanylate cyclase (GGDEF)-like protein
LRAYLIVAVVAVLGFLALPDGGLLQVAWQVGIGWAAAATIAVGVVRNRPAAPAAWWLFALGVAGNATGILIETVLTHTLGESGFPSWADIAYLSMYPTIAAGLVLLVRRRARGRDRAALVDATTLTTGLGLLAWIFMVRPAAEDPTIGLLGHIASVSYPVGDVVLVAMTARLMVGGSGRNASFRLLCAALVAFLCGDSGWAVVNQLGWVPGPTGHRLLSVLFLVGYLLFGAAATHPDARSVGRAADAGRQRLSRGLLGLLTVTSLIAPAVLTLQAVRHRVTDGLAISIGCAALFLLVVTRMSQLLTELESQSSKVRELSLTDDLTGLPNRRAWNAELPRAIERARRTGEPLSVAMIDLDHFKRFNDSYGHPAGDRLLKEAAAIWQEQLRTVDHLARYGGEEFVVLLPDTAAAVGRQILDRLRVATPLGQTFSAGLATWEHIETSDELIARADRALYEAKDAGRDRVHPAAPATVPT